MKKFITILLVCACIGCAVNTYLAPEQQEPGKISGEMVLIPAGTFAMGSTQGDPDELPVHDVSVAAFYMDSHEVTNAEYKLFADATNHSLPPFWKPEFDKPNEPVVGVSWDDARAYAAWAGKRLPTEAEWEFASRGGKNAASYPWGDCLDAGAANFKSFGILPVMSFPANAYGLYDMAGNVWEWCSDWYGVDFYAVSPGTNVTGPIAGELKVLRGGAWYCGPDEVRVSNRFYASPGGRSFNVGFRCARDVR